MNRRLKAFLIYAYVFIFLYMLNSLITWFFMLKHLSPWLGTAVEALIMVFGLFLAFKKLMERYYGVEDGKQVALAWLFHFVPFIVLSFVLFLLLIKAIPNPSLAVFIYLNADIVVLYFTFNFAVKKFIEEKVG